MITIINYGSGNVQAIANIYERLNIPWQITNDPALIKGAEKIILPGVGAFDETMSKLNDSGLRKVLDEKVLAEKTPVLGICVGMQILTNTSEEGKESGLGWIGGKVKKLDISVLMDLPKIPHLGWNSIALRNNDELLFKGVDTETGYYFLHSYYFECENPDHSMAQTLYGKNFTTAVNRENVYGVQFHPEKSHHNGIQLLKNFAELIC